MAYQVLLIAGNPTEAIAARRRLGRKGYQFRAMEPRGQELGESSSVVHCKVTSNDDAMKALSWAAMGYSLLVEVEDQSQIALCLIDDLERIGPVEFAKVTPNANSGDLSATQIALLTLLRDGSTLTDAADSLFLSRRTANRRLTEARTFFGTKSHRETILAFADHSPSEES
jgi:DNA-binding NarL/FixJ family response regulator